MLRVEEAQSLVLENVKGYKIEKVGLLETVGCTLYEEIRSDRDYPPYNRSAMDGYALKSESINKLRVKEFRVLEKTLAGEACYKGSMGEEECVSIMTGSEVPDGADAVVAYEQTEERGEGVVKVLEERVKRGQNISHKGEDIVEGSVVLGNGSYIDHSAVNVLASLGYKEVKIYGKPRVSIVSTGDEVQPLGVQPKSYQIRDSNTYVLETLLRLSVGIKSVRRVLVGDDKEQLKHVIKECLEEDIIILSGGVSMGDADYVPEVLEGLGVRKVFHKVSVKPGKPIWFGATEKGVIYGLPGNPLSCQVTYKLFIEPYIRALMKIKPMSMEKMVLKGERTKKGVRDDYFPCTADYERGELSLLSYNGSGDIKAGLGSNGIGLHPGDIKRLEAGSVVDYYRWF